MNKTRSLLLSLVILAVFALCACGKEEPTQTLTPISEAPSSSPTVAPTPSLTPTPTNTPTPTLTPTETPTPTPDYKAMGYERSVLTGLWIPGEYVNMRPYAVMVNNIRDAYPQSSISRASVVYECMEEFGITRMMCLYEAFCAEDEVCKRVGSVRSGRPYFIDFSRDFDTIYVHFGFGDAKTGEVKNYINDSIDGIKGSIGLNCFYRDNTLPSPHNCFLDLPKLALTLKNASKYRKTMSESLNPPFSFYEEEEEIKDSKPAKKVTVNFSTYAKPYFLYNEETGTYDRYQWDVQHKDSQTGDPYTFKNVIVMLVTETTIEPTSDFQYINLDSKSSGSGYYFCNGKYIAITWDRVPGTTRFYDASGKPLVINPGKTYIAVCPKKSAKGVVIE